jgi:hypothetical protein
MTEVINTSDLKEVEGKRILFDANIWIMVEGFSASANQHKVNLYSSAYGLLRQKNQILINDYVLGEFCNRCAKLEFDAHVAALELPAGSFQPQFKRFRQTPEFAGAMESVRDTCLNLLDDCVFVPAAAGEYHIDELLNEFCAGRLDFSDLVLREFCRKQDAMLMTDDADFAGCDLTLITANKWLLKA